MIAEPLLAAVETGTAPREILPGAWIHPPVVLSDEPVESTWSAQVHQVGPASPPGSGSEDRWPEPTLTAAGAGLVGSLHIQPRGGPVELRWTLRWMTDGFAAIELPLSLRLEGRAAPELLLPGIHYGSEADEPVDAVTRYGVYPRLDAVRGFALRADRLPQVALLAGDAEATWAVYAPSEAPAPASAGMVYSLAADLVAPDRLRVMLRYPQVERGHVPGAPALAYLAKSEVGHGEERRRRWRAGERLTVRFLLWRLSGPPNAHAGAVARRLWQGKRASWDGPRQPLAEVRSRIAWVDRHLWRPELGQYESPQGSGTAMAGFVEMSLSTAAVIARVGLLPPPSAGGESRSIQGESAEPRVDHAVSAIDSWLSEGLTPDGLLLPCRDGSGFHSGRRWYTQGFRLSSEPAIEALRPTVEARAVLRLLRQAGPGGLGADRSERWRAALMSIGEWLMRQRQGHGLPGTIWLEGHSQEDDSGSAHLVALLADLAQDEPDAERAGSLSIAAELAYAAGVRPRIHARRFGGVTLDAACPDREAVLAALDASLALHEASGDRSYLADASAAVDVLLTYVYAYRIRTFGVGSDAHERRISTLGGSLVSAENQHLDPFPVGPSLVRYGLYAGDRTALKVGAANLSWCLDGRWAIEGRDGSKQPEQFNHTAWHYDTSVLQRGDYRRGMSAFGLSDSEHGWNQALPLDALMELGHAVIDWPTGRVASLPGMHARGRRTSTGLSLTVAQCSGRPGTLENPLLLRVLRPPRAADLAITLDGELRRVPWPAPLAAFAVEPQDGAHTIHLDVSTDASAPVGQLPEP